jgi:capsid assembly protease
MVLSRRIRIGTRRRTMIRIDYAMQNDLVEQYVKTKDAIIEAREKMSADEVEKSKAEIIASAQINQIDKETGLAEFEIRDRVAYIPVEGMLAEQVDVCAAFFGESVTTYGYIREAAKEADENPLVQKIVFLMNSGGGAVNGVSITSEVIRGLSKPTVAAVSDMAASACYWLASQCDEIVGITNTGFYGSIGVVTEIVDRKKGDEAQGIKRYVITNVESKDKRPDVSKKEGMDVVLERLGAIYGVFSGSILIKRTGKLDQEKIDGLHGKMLIAEEALQYGLIDKLISSSELGEYIKEESPAVGGVNITKEGLMNFNEFIDSNPEAKAEHEALIAEAIATGKKEAVKAESERVAEILNLSGAVLSDEIMTAIKEGQSAGEYAKAALKVANVKLPKDNAEELKGISGAHQLSDDLPKDEKAAAAVKAQNDALDDYYGKKEDK